MTLEEKFDNEIWWVLQKLSYIRNHSNKKRRAHFIIPARPAVDEPTETVQWKALHEIGERGCIEIVRQEMMETNYGLNYIVYLNFLPKFDELYDGYRRMSELFKDGVQATSNKTKTPKQDNLLYTKKLEPEITVGDLGAYSDGTIRYKNEIINLRKQLKDLCRLFMRHPERLLTIDDIRAEIISASKGKITPNSTISKYVSELHNSLKIHFKRDVIFSQQQEGWYFKL